MVKQISQRDFKLSRIQRTSQPPTPVEIKPSHQKVLGFLIFVFVLGFKVMENEFDPEKRC